MHEAILSARRSQPVLIPGDWTAEDRKHTHPPKGGQLVRVRVSYELLPYEREFLTREIEALGGRVVRRTSAFSTLVEGLPPERARLLTYGSQVVYPGSQSVATIQSLRERSGWSQKQDTRYGPHSIHQYKGKFHPQTPRSLILQHEWDADLPILDPFAGTGTTLVEARGLGYTSEGVELNPLAVMVARARLAWEEPPSDGPPSIAEIEAAEPTCWDPGVESYLARWFPYRTLQDIKQGLGAITGMAPNDALVARALLSNLLRSYSWQDPGDLRIHRRAVIPHMPPLLQAFARAIDLEWDRRKRWIDAGLSSSECRATISLGDSRRISQVRGLGRVSGSVTSPPYASALPYVDTYRLSLVALGLSRPEELGGMEYETIGGRDVESDDRERFEDRLEGLPIGSRSLISDVVRRLVDDKAAGFRRRAVPFALARYLVQMREVIRELRLLEGEDAPNLWVVGPNSTTIRSERVSIPTPALVGELAVAEGFRCVTLRKLDAFQRFGVHSKNAIREETLVSFRG